MPTSRTSMCTQLVKSHCIDSSWFYTSFQTVSIYNTIYYCTTSPAMRLPYIPNPPEFTEEADKAILERIKERRGEKGLIALDRTLLHSPPVADGW